MTCAEQSEVPSTSIPSASSVATARKNCSMSSAGSSRDPAIASSCRNRASSNSRSWQAGMASNSYARPNAISSPMLTHYWRSRHRRQSSSISPFRIIRPASPCPSPTFAACMPACHRMSCWCSISPMANFFLAADLATLMQLAFDSDNVIATRTFSKAYGLAALRVGWALAPLMDDARPQSPARRRQYQRASAGSGDCRSRRSSNSSFMSSRDGEGARLPERSSDAARPSPCEGPRQFPSDRISRRDGKRATDFIAFAMGEEGIWLRPVGEPGFTNS